MLGVRGQCVWYLVIAIIFMGLRGAKRQGATKDGGGGGVGTGLQFSWRQELTPLDTMI